MKTKDFKKVRKIIQKINKDLAADVFKNRFWVRMVRYDRTPQGEYFLYELKDRLEPERDYLHRGWECAYSFNSFIFSDIIFELNEFIIRSDFWNLYRGDRYEEADDFYKWRNIFK